MKRYVGIFIIAFCFFFAGAVSGEEHDQPLAPDLSGIDVLDLQTAQGLALASNPTMTAAMERVEQARARVRQAAAAWWPSVDLTGSVPRHCLISMESLLTAPQRTIARGCRHPGSCLTDFFGPSVTSRPITVPSLLMPRKGMSRGFLFQQWQKRT